MPIFQPIESVRNQGFTLTFDNGLSIRAEFGPDKVCSNFDCAISPQSRDTWGTVTAEVTVVDSNGQPYPIDSFGIVTEEANVGVEVLGRMICSTQNTKIKTLVK